MNLSDDLVFMLLSAILNGAVTWGVITTKIQWLRKDVDKITDKHDNHMQHYHMRKGEG